MMFSSKPSFICTNCGSQSNPIRKNKGSGFLELMLYLFLVSIPLAVIYSIWRRTATEPLCPKCRKPTLIPINSPNGEKLLVK